MKGLIVLVCALVAVQARSTAVSKSPVRAAAALGENPWVVHLRIAVSTSGLLETCAGSLIDQSWVLTSGSCVEHQRFIWIRYGAVKVFNPELVTEASIVRFDDSGRIALISINRVVQSTDNISPVAIARSDAETPESATFCSYNDPDDRVPGEVLNCNVLALESKEDRIVADFEVSRYDLGAALVKDGVQYGVLTGTGHDEATFARPGDYLEWIEEETGLDFDSNVDAVVAADDGTKVNVVN